MKHLIGFAAGLALGLLAPAAALADQDLEVTMEVIDDLSELDGIIAEMPGPGKYSFREDGEGIEIKEEPGDSSSRDENDGFEHDKMDEDRFERDLQEESDFEEGEDVDLDLDRFEEEEGDEMEEPGEHDEK